MSLVQQMIDDATTILANTDEHALAITVIDEDGLITRNVPVIIEHKSSDVEQVPYGRDQIQRAMIGIPSTYEVTDDWQFEIDGLRWAVARDQAAPIADDSAGWLWITIVTAPIHDRGDPKFNAR